MKDGCAYSFFCWLAQILVWATLVWMIASTSSSSFDKDDTESSVYCFAICYVAYLALEFCSSSSKYICHKTTQMGIYDQMGKYYMTYPVIQFHCECYHYETRRRRVTTRDSKGRRRTRTVTERVRVTTYRETYKMPYYSARDVSGLFYLDCDRAMIQRKYYIQLDIYEEINFADAISYMDYEREKDIFWRRNRFRDVHFDFRESRYVPGLIQENLIKLTESEPCCINFFFYFLYTIITVVEFYKLYFNYLCIHQTYRIRKLVSTRYDLNQPVYQDFVPRIDIISQQYNYTPNYYNYINNDYSVKVPTKQELANAAKYQDKVPDYKISSGGGQFHAGVIIDNPSYSSYDVNKPPEAFTSVGGNVALKRKQTNSKGAPPPGFGQPDFKFDIAKDDETDDDDDQPNQGFGSNAAPVSVNINNQGNAQNLTLKQNSERIQFQGNQYQPQ